MPEVVTLRTTTGQPVNVTTDELLNAIATHGKFRIFGMDMTAIVQLRAEYMKRVAGPIPSTITKSHIRRAFSL